MQALVHYDVKALKEMIAEQTVSEVERLKLRMEELQKENDY